MTTGCTHSHPMSYLSLSRLLLGSPASTFVIFRSSALMSIAFIPSSSLQFRECRDVVERERAEVVEGVGVRPPPVVAALTLLDVVVAAEDVDGRHVAVRPDLRAVLREPRLELRLFLRREFGVARTFAVCPLKSPRFQLRTYP